jgi:hypothetical protein
MQRKHHVALRLFLLDATCHGWLAVSAGFAFLSAVSAFGILVVHEDKVALSIISCPLAAGAVFASVMCHRRLQRLLTTLTRGMEVIGVVKAIHGPFWEKRVLIEVEGDRGSFSVDRPVRQGFASRRHVFEARERIALRVDAHPPAIVLEVREIEGDP